MRRWNLRVVLLAGCALLLAACGATGVGSGPDPQTAAGGGSAHSSGGGHY